MPVPTLVNKRKLKVGLLSLGCPKTLVDSEIVLGKIDRARYQLSANIADCDIAMINTCAFIEDAQQESVEKILRLIELKKAGEIQKLIVLGCLVQRFPKELQRELKEVDAFVGSGEYSKICEVVDQVAFGKQVATVGVPGYLYTSAEHRVRLTSAHSRYLKISEGCDHTCSFCVIPSFRGRHRSRSMNDVIREAENLAAEGAKELILVGQDTTFFGYDRVGRYLLPDLLKRLNTLSGVRWIRMLYAYPSLVSHDLIEAIASCDKVCHYLDMPLQHTSDRILKSMRRGTTQESIGRLLRKLRERIPDLAIRTTFIVGYPGETDPEFQEVLNLMEEIRFDRLGIFLYSPEEGSPAAALPDPVPDRIKRKRLEDGMLLQQKISEENNRRLVGQTLEVLIEEKHEKENLWSGRTYMDAPEVDGTVFIKKSNQGIAPKDLRPGKFITARITETREYDLFGEPIANS